MSERLHDPYRHSAAPEQDRQAGVLPVSLDGRGYLIDTSRQTNQSERFRRSSLQLLNTQQNIDKGESGLTSPEVWRRTYQSWHHGAGQKVADREDSDLFRFNTSKGVDVWERWQIGLLNSVVKQTDHTYKGGLLVSGYSVGISAGATIVINDGTAEKAVALGNVLYPLYTSGGKYLFCLCTTTDSTPKMVLRLYEISGSGTGMIVTQFGSDQEITGLSSPTLLVFANFKLLACNFAGNVYDITEFANPNNPPTATAVGAPVLESPMPGFTWVAGCQGKKSIYLLGRQGDKTTVHAVTISDADKTLDGGVVAELPDGERGTAIYSYLGYVAIGTHKGFRFAAMADSAGGLTYGPLIETPQPVLCFEGQDRFLYYGLSGYDAFDSGIGRADLSQFVADLQPAYASDLMGPNVGGQPTMFINTLPNGKIIFGTSGTSFLQADTYVASGELVGSAWTFNVVDRKTGLYLLVQNSIDSGGAGEFEAYYDRSTLPSPIGNVVSNDSAETRFPLVDVTFNSAAIAVTMQPSADKRSSPHIYGLELRATYIRGAASEWQVPVILSDSIELDNGSVQSRDVVNDFEHLLGLVQSGKQFVYIEDDRRWGVYATDFIWSPQERSVHQGWQGVFTIYFREVR